jgi:hypothetical protein
LSENSLPVQLVIFVGPSLYGCQIEHLDHELWLPPAQCGDVVRMAGQHPKKILLIDGVFAQALAVWHKEIVYALLEGVVCIGAASMGALRASEMHRYGMIGIGKIFEMYRDGEEDDSLVAMSFDPETFRPLQHAPLQHLKADDALSAIQFARSYDQPVSTTLTKDAMGPYTKFVIDRILFDN